MKPVSIVGGGLAGLTLGIVLRRHGMGVTIHEAGRYPRHRVCGEFLCGISDHMLQTAGLKDIWPQQPRLKDSAWWLGNRMKMKRPLPGTALGVSRHRLDNALARHFQCLGGRLLTGSRFADDPGEGIVFATGKKACTSRRWIGLKLHVRDYPLDADLEMHLGDGAYFGASKIEDGQVNVCGLARIHSGIRGSFPDLLMSYLRRSGLNVLADRIDVSNVDADSFSTTAGFEPGYQPADAGRCQIGDTFAMVPPFTGNGMSMAIESAVIASDSLLGYSSGRINWSDCIQCIREKLHRRFRRRLLLAKWLHPFLVYPSGQRLAMFCASMNLLPFDRLFHQLRNS